MDNQQQPPADFKFGLRPYSFWYTDERAESAYLHTWSTIIEFKQPVSDPAALNLRVHDLVLRPMIVCFDSEVYQVQPKPWRASGL